MKDYNHKNLKIINADCMDIMKDYEDNYFDLAIVDPPYGIGISGQKKAYQKIPNTTENIIKKKNGIAKYQMKYILMNYLECQKIRLFGGQIILLSI